MRRQDYSIRRRLALFAALIVVIAMSMTGIGLTWLFQRQIDMRVGQEMDAHLQQIVGDLRFNPDGTVKLSRELSDPRFGKVFGGLYFQVTAEAGDVLLKSRSLWDTRLDLPTDLLDIGAVHVHRRPGPMNSMLLMHESRVIFADGDKARTLRITVGIDADEIRSLRMAFSTDLVPALGLLAVLLISGFILQIRIGLRPLDALRQHVAQVRSGHASRLTGDVPSEVMPLVEEVNSLLDLQDQNMKRARDRSADLAHGLKTPLTALGADIARLRTAGQTAVADDIQLLATRMQRHIDRELARSRFRHGRLNARVPARLAMDALARTLSKTPRGEMIAFQNRIDESIVIAMDQQDFLEVAGNLAENAMRHAKTTVSFDALLDGNSIAIRIDDDGSGLPLEQIAKVMERGVRLDVSDEGAGLGLAIAKDVMDAYGGQLSLENRKSGGLSATIKLPIVGPAQE